MSDERLKQLTIEARTYISECRRFSCPSCNKQFHIHPTKWFIHLEECTGDLTVLEKIELFKQEKDENTKEILGSIVLQSSQFSEPN